ncbi:MAG: hypothetical protein HOY44_03480 [Maritimibacter sp.]|uniref:hypothetical protein n=1 Tax=Maritimibacter sp. TaxID=2003363 RepID=UPI001DF5AABC|nr:hypothetical protein [Maritimibacter sp.]MBL6426573.1 hypothetical protein [Maritimibacter sp.]
MKKTITLKAKSAFAIGHRSIDSDRKIRLIRNDTANRRSPLLYDFGAGYGTFEVFPHQAYRHAQRLRAAMRGGLGCKPLELVNGNPLRRRGAEIDAVFKQASRRGRDFEAVPL